jgi:CheY-like chemotaxis protein
MKVLIVDDSSLNRKMSKHLIKSESLLLKDPIIEEADDGDTALVMFRQAREEGKPFNLILLDSVMERVSGPEMVKTLRNVDRYNGVVIGLTGNVLPEDISNFLEHGATYVITKPLQKQKLMSLLALENFLSAEE